MSNPLALLSWWRAVRSAYPRDPSIPVLRFSNLEVTAGDLDAVCSLIESRVTPSHADPQETPLGDDD